MQGVQFICSSTEITIQILSRALCVIQLLKLALTSEKIPVNPKNDLWHVLGQLKLCNAVMAINTVSLLSVSFHIYKLSLSG